MNKNPLQTQLLINGQWCDALDGARLAVRNPADDSILADVACAGSVDTERAIDAAVQAQEVLQAMTAAQRAALLRDIGEQLSAQQESIASLLTAEQGKPLPEARLEVEYARGFFSVAADQLLAIEADAARVQRFGDKDVVLSRRSVGVTASITPWNFPLAMNAKKFAPALAMACPQIHKPSEQTPLTALAFGQLCCEVGVPAGALNIVMGDPVAIGEALLKSEHVRRVSFTGSTEVGRLLRRNAGAHLPQLAFELGGHAPFIVTASADIDDAVAGAIACKFRNGGQACISANRFLVHRSMYSSFIERLVKCANELRVGRGTDPDVAIGPLINDAAIAKVERHVADAIECGARLCLGGKRVRPTWLGRESPSRFYAPTVLADCTPRMLTFQEETFGPVCPIMAFDSEAQAIALANDSPYGLAAYVWSGDPDEGLRIAEALEVGIVGVNDPSPATPFVPFGGVKASGWGREGGREALLEYAPTTTISFGQ